MLKWLLILLLVPSGVLAEKPEALTKYLKQFLGEKVTSMKGGDLASLKLYDDIVHGGRFTRKALRKSEQHNRKGESKPRGRGFEAISSRMMIKKLKNAGWELKRTSGDHRQFHQPGRPDRGLVTVPQRQTLSRRDYRSILRQAGWKR